MSANEPKVSNVTILSGDTESSSFLLTPIGSRSGHALVGVIFPAELTGTLLSLEGSIGDGNFLPIVDSEGNAVTITKTNSSIVWVDAAFTAACRIIRVVSDAAEGADRTIGLVGRRVE